ncbi:MAG: hypothetical protein DI537_25040 [Stutzerimonas stutzeri]|nr:MAG: hypothetical protein DI537_25040 [Stutzerimonas stutzeri]
MCGEKIVRSRRGWLVGAGARQVAAGPLALIGTAALVRRRGISLPASSGINRAASTPGTPRPFADALASLRS